MKRFKNNKQLLRITGMVVTMLVVAGGVTFAVLQSQQTKLTDNSIQTASAELQISRDGTNYASEQTGFHFTNVIPGVDPSPANSANFYLRNSGTAPLTIRMAMSNMPTMSPNPIDPGSMHFILQPFGDNSSPDNMSLQALTDSYSNGNPDTFCSTSVTLQPGETKQLTLGVSIDQETTIYAGTTLSNFDFVFAGESLRN